MAKSEAKNIFIVIVLAFAIVTFITQLNIISSHIVGENLGFSVYMRGFFIYAGAYITNTIVAIVSVIVMILCLVMLRRK